MSRCMYSYDVDGSAVSVLDPAERDYLRDAADYGVEPAPGRFIVGIGPDNPDVVLFGSRDALVKVARDMLARLGA